MDKIQKNEQLLTQIEDVVQILWKNLGNGNEKILACVKEVNVIFKEFLARVPEFQEYGVDIPQEVLLMQLKNLVNGFEQKDMVLLADTLEYEVKNTILFYNDILRELEKERE